MMGVGLYDQTLPDFCLSIKYPVYLKKIYTNFFFYFFCAFRTKGPQIAYERSFRWKLAHFRYLCQVIIFKGDFVMTNLLQAAGRAVPPICQCGLRLGRWHPSYSFYSAVCSAVCPRLCRHETLTNL